MDKVISIIVPTYNMEEYLKASLNSLLIDKGLNRIEIIVVNDGSVDKSLEIAQEFERAYPESFKIIDKKNGNYGSCINSALKIIRGRYVKIMDSDDSYHTAALESLVDLLEKLDVDMVFTDYVKEYSYGGRVNYVLDLPEGKVVDIKDCYRMRAFLNIQMPAITYNADVLRRANYHQTEGISYTDMEWCFSPVTLVNNIYYLGVCVYRYRLGRPGQTMDPIVFRQRIQQRMQSFYSMLESVANQVLSFEMKEFTEQQLVKYAIPIYDFYLLYNPELSRNTLRKFDERFRELNPSSYYRCDKIEYRLHIPYQYIRAWRRRDVKSIPICYKVLKFFLDIAGSIRIRLFMKENPNVEK